MKPKRNREKYDGPSFWTDIAVVFVAALMLLGLGILIFESGGILLCKII